MELEPPLAPIALPTAPPEPAIADLPAPPCALSPPNPPLIGKEGKIGKTGATGTRPPQMPRTQMTPFSQCTPVRWQSQTPPIGFMSVHRTSAVVSPQHFRPAGYCPLRPSTQGELTGRGTTGTGRMGTTGVGMRPPQNPPIQRTSFWQCKPVRCQSQTPPI